MGAEKEKIHAIASPGLRVASGHQGQASEKGGSEQENAEEEEGEGGFFEADLSEDDGEGDDASCDQDAGFVICRGAELEMLLLDGPQNLNLLGDVGRG